MNLELLKSKKILFFILIAVVVIGLIIYAYISVAGKIIAAKIELGKLDAQWKTIQQIKQSEKKLLEEEKTVVNNTKNITKNYPKELPQEKELFTLKTMADKAGVNVKNIGFTPITKAKDALKMTVTLTFSGSYEQIRNWVENIKNNSEKITIDQLVFNGIEKELKGSASISFLGYVQSDYVPEAWVNTIPQGKNDIFSIFKGAEYILGNKGATTSTQESVGPPQFMPRPTGSASAPVIKNVLYDFYMVINPPADAATAVVVGKSNTSEGEKTSNVNGQNIVNIYFEETNGKMMYRYRTDEGIEGSFPVKYDLKEFSPLQTGKIVIYVVSKPKIAADDNVNVILNVFNFTKTDVVVKTNDPADKPRLQLKNRQGNVLLGRE